MMMTYALIGVPGHWELILILVLVMIFFGAGKLPEVAKAVGKSIKTFKNAQKDETIDVTGSLAEPKEGVDVAVNEAEKSKA
jgi:sec-independent protein translocase protein TatA